MKPALILFYALVLAFSACSKKNGKGSNAHLEAQKPDTAEVATDETDTDPNDDFTERREKHFDDNYTGDDYTGDNDLDGEGSSSSYDNTVAADPDCKGGVKEVNGSLVDCGFDVHTRYATLITDCQGKDCRDKDKEKHSNKVDRLIRKGKRKTTRAAKKDEKNCCEEEKAPRVKNVREKRERTPREPREKRERTPREPREKRERTPREPRVKKEKVKVDKKRKEKVKKESTPKVKREKTKSKDKERTKKKKVAKEDTSELREKMKEFNKNKRKEKNLEKEEEKLKRQKLKEKQKEARKLKRAQDAEERKSRVKVKVSKKIKTKVKEDEQEPRDVQVIEKLEQKEYHQFDVPERDEELPEPVQPAPPKRNVRVTDPIDGKDFNQVDVPESDEKIEAPNFKMPENDDDKKRVSDLIAKYTEGEKSKLDEVQLNEIVNSMSDVDGLLDVCKVSGTIESEEDLFETDANGNITVINNVSIENALLINYTTGDEYVGGQARIRTLMDDKKLHISAMELRTTTGQKIAETDFVINYEDDAKAFFESYKVHNTTDSKNGEIKIQKITLNALKDRGELTEGFLVMTKRSVIALVINVVNKNGNNTYCIKGGNI